MIGRSASASGLLAQVVGRVPAHASNHERIPQTRDARPPCDVTSGHLRSEERCLNGA